jgi:uncharacterized membrane protein
VRQHLSLFVGTLVLRPYVLAFFLLYLLGSVTKVGWVRTAVFAAIAFAVSLAAELSSTRNGIPYGLFQYVDATRDAELWLGSVPLWTGLFFAAVCWSAFQTAVLLWSPLELRRGDFQVLDTIAIRRSGRVLVTGAVLVTALGGLLEPLKVRGDRWFLGALYAYPEGGLYFGAPATAFAGMLVTALVTIGLYQRIEPLLLRPTRLLRAGQAHLPLGGLVEPACYLTLVAFALAVTLWLGEQQVALVGLLVFVPLTVVAAAHVLGVATRATPAEREAHRHDFPRARTLE